MKKVFSLMLALILVLSIAVPGMAAGKTKVTLSHKGTVTVSLGETLQLTATVTPDTAVKWKSSKKSVATVDASGLVTPVKEGKATISAKAGGKTAKVTIKVVDPYKPTKLSINQGKKVTLSIDKTLQLTTAFTPSTAKSDLTYKSSKKSVATVGASGIVTPKKEGTAKITVTAKSNKKAKATITIKVVDPYKPTKLSINQGKSVSLGVGETLNLSTSLTPATAKAELSFKSSKKSVATVDANGRITALKKGTAKITVTAKNNKKAKATITVKVVPAKPAPTPEPTPVQIANKYNVLDFLGETLATINNSIPNRIEYSSRTDSYSNGYLWVDLDSSQKVKLVGLMQFGEYHLLGIQPGNSLSQAISILEQFGFTESYGLGGVTFKDTISYVFKDSIFVSITHNGTNVKSLLIGFLH